MPNLSEMATKKKPLSLSEMSVQKKRQELRLYEPPSEDEHISAISQEVWEAAQEHKEYMEKRRAKPPLSFLPEWQKRWQAGERGVVPDLPEQYLHGVAESTYLDKLFGKESPKARLPSEKVARGAGKLHALIGELGLAGGAVGKVAGALPRAATALDKALRLGLIVGARGATQEARKKAAEEIHGKDVGYKGAVGVLEDFAYGAIFSLALTGAGKALGPIWSKLRPTEQSRALKLLGLKKGATEEQIQAAARKIFLQTHPDKVKGAVDKFQAVVKARETLLRPEGIITAKVKPTAPKQITGISEDKILMDVLHKHGTAKAPESVEKIGAPTLRSVADLMHKKVPMTQKGKDALVRNAWDRVMTAAKTSKPPPTVAPERPRMPQVERKAAQPPKIEAKGNRYKGVDTATKESFLKIIYQNLDVVNDKEARSYYEELKQSFTKEEAEEFKAVTGVLDKRIAYEAPPPKIEAEKAKPKIKKIGRPGFVDLTPIAEAGQQARTKAQAIGKGLTRFTGVEKAVQKTLIEFEEQMRELPKVAARESVEKFGHLTEEQEKIIENYRELGQKFPEEYKLPPELRNDYDKLIETQEALNKRREALGYPGDWPGTKIKGLEKKLEKLRQREEPDVIAEEMVEEALDELKDLRYLHHQYKPAPKTKRIRQWFRRRITKKPRGVLGRKIPTYKKAEEIGLERVPLAVSMAHYQYEIERAEAADALIKAISGNPNLSQWEEEAPSDWVYLSENVFPDSVQRMMWAEEGKVKQRIRRKKFPAPIADALEELSYATTSKHAIGRWYDRINQALKYVGFYNPYYMGRYDLEQMWRAAGTLRTINPQNWVNAIKIFAKKGEEYEKLRKAGLFNNVVNYVPAVKDITQKMIDKIRISKGERAAKAALEYLNPFNIFNTIRKFNEVTTWNIDEIARIACHEAVKDSKMLKGLTEFEKIEWVNDAMVNYAKLPKGTKKWLSRFFFVPTYRIGNFRYFWGQVAKHPWRYKGPMLRTVGYKMFIQFGLPSLVAAAIAYKIGKKKDVWTEKGYRMVIHNPETGKDTVYAISGPLLEGAKVTQRTALHTFRVNMAALPHLVTRVLSGPRYKDTKDPIGEFFKIGTPFYRDVVNWTDPDKETYQKILNQLGVAFVYSRKHKPQDEKTAVEALARAVSIWKDWKEQKEEVEGVLGRKFYGLMSQKELLEYIRENTYKKGGVITYKGKKYRVRRGQANLGKEEEVNKARKVLRRKAQ